MWGEGTTTLGWTKRTDPMPYTDIVSFTMAGRKQSSQCQSSQTPTNHTSDESKRVSGLWRGTKMSYLTVAKSSFKERSQHPECRGDLHRSDQCQRRVQKTHICRRGFKEHIWRGFKKNTFADGRQDEHGDPKQLIDKSTPTLKREKLFLKNLSLSFVSVFVINLLNFSRMTFWLTRTL